MDDCKQPVSYTHLLVETLFDFLLPFSYERAHLTAVRRKQRAAYRTEQKPDCKFLHIQKILLTENSLRADFPYSQYESIYSDLFIAFDKF